MWPKPSAAQQVAGTLAAVFVLAFLLLWQYPPRPTHPHAESETVENLLFDAHAKAENAVLNVYDKNGEQLYRLSAKRVQFFPEQPSIFHKPLLKRFATHASRSSWSVSAGCAHVTFQGSQGALGQRKQRLQSITLQDKVHWVEWIQTDSPSPHQPVPLQELRTERWLYRAEPDEARIPETLVYTNGNTRITGKQGIWNGTTRVLSVQQHQETLIRP